MDAGRDGGNVLVTDRRDWATRQEQSCFVNQAGGFCNSGCDDALCSLFVLLREFERFPNLDLDVRRALLTSAFRSSGQTVGTGLPARSSGSLKQK